MSIPIIPPDFRPSRASWIFPIYLSRLTAPCVAWNEYTPKLEMFQAGATFTIGDIDVTSFTIPHDAADPVGFTFRAQGIRFAIATDLGYLPDSIRFHLSARTCCCSNPITIWKC